MNTKYRFNLLNTKQDFLVLLVLLSMFISVVTFGQQGKEEKSASTETAAALLNFSNDNLKQRYHDLIGELRCPKCQNQNLADSDAPIAEDLRNELFRLLNEDYSDDQILQFMTTRYGNFVLYKPPFESNTAVLWGLPALLLVGGLMLLGFLLKRNRSAEQKPHNKNPLFETISSDELDKQVAAILQQAKNDVEGG